MPAYARKHACLRTQEPESLRRAIEGRIRAALPDLEEDEVGVVWMQPAQFSQAARGGAEDSCPKLHALSPEV
jgi:hypothetical protein